MKLQLQRKWIRRFLRSVCIKMRYGICKILIASIAIALTTYLLISKRNTVAAHFSPYCEPIDVVYTWVNGSDTKFIESARRYDVTFDTARFDDKNELRYSLRSLELHAPWIRHVYIVTNGQIPHWLDLSYERVTIVPHEVLTPNLELLPTFSSAAIETFLHRIPQLSQRFLYMNDDIFLGAPLYPEDLYTDSEGVRIYQAWMVPDCAVDCPWTYIGDGSCDRHCNIAECQYDGGDCSNAKSDYSEEKSSRQKHHKLSRKSETTKFQIRKFPLRKKYRNVQLNARNNSTHFKEILRHKNLTTLTELRRIVDSYNDKLKSRLHRSFTTSIPTTIAGAEAPLGASLPSQVPHFQSFSPHSKSTKDIYSHSLIHTNMLLNGYYGFKARNVLAHVGFLLDRYIIEEMQLKFADEVLLTASHRFRASNDLQFAFAYYSFLMSETFAQPVSEIFDEFDTDSSKTWSDREVRTFLTRMYPLPLDWSAVRFLEEVVSNCSRDLGFNKHTNTESYSTLVYERYEDSKVPTITRELVIKCQLLAEALEANFAARSKYKYNINSKRSGHSNFMMLTSNVTEVVDELDKMRRSPRKFNCINDNLEPQYTDENELIRHLLEDFYLSFFPRRSKFELEPLYRNRFADWHEYQRWRRRKRAALVVGYSLTLVLIVFVVRFLCIHKAKFVRRCIQRL